MNIFSKLKTLTFLFVLLANVTMGADPAQPDLGGKKPEQVFAEVVSQVATADLAKLPELKAQTQQALDQAQSSAEAFIAQLKYEEAFNVLIAVRNGFLALNDQTGPNLFQSEGDFSVRRQQFSNLLCQVSIKRSRDFLAKQDLKNARMFAEGAVGLGAPLYELEAKKLLATILQQQNDLNAAVAIWEKIKQDNAANENALEADTKIAELRQLQAASPAVTPATATPAEPAVAPLATPGVASATPAPIEDLGDVAAAAENQAKNLQQVVQNAPESIKNMDYKSFGGKALAFVQDEDFINWAIIVASIIVGYWVIWYYVMKLLVKMGNIRASLWIDKVKKYGFVAFLIFAFGGISFEKKEKVSRTLCPKCQKPIDDLDSYGNLNFYACPSCNEAIKPIYNLSDYIGHLSDALEKLTGRSGNGIESPLERDAMAKLVRSMLTKSVRERTTDLHVESTIDGVNVRARRDGMLGEFAHFTKQVGTPMLNALMIQAQLDITQHMVPQDGKFAAWVDGADIDIRLNSAPGPYGPNITMRMLDRRRITVDSTQLGLENRNLELFERSIRHAHGLILVTGPSGSGKSTTLYVALNTLNNGDRSIITIEDPIEYQLPGLKQMQVNIAQHFTFATGLRSILRQDPDVIMVGEIRDKETADIALDAAITGHLVFTTLHTIDSASAITRMRDLGIEPRRYAEALDLVLAQRLIRINCAKCKKSYKPQQKDLEQLQIVPTKDQLFFHGQGCEDCTQTGYLGRTGIFETLEMAPAIKEILETNVSTPVIRELARKSGMRTLREEGILKILQGQTTPDEILRVTS